MPFDPALSQPDMLADADQMRAQLNGLKDLIDAVPGITGAVVDAVHTLPAGEEAGVAVTVEGTTLHFTFSIPQGADGEVTEAQLDEAILNRTAASVAGISQLDDPFNDPPVTGDLEVIRAKLNELIMGLQEHT